MGSSFSYEDSHGNFPTYYMLFCGLFMVMVTWYLFIDGWVWAKFWQFILPYAACGKLDGIHLSIGSMSFAFLNGEIYLKDVEVVQGDVAVTFFRVVIGFHWRESNARTYAQIGKGGKSKYRLDVKLDGMALYVFNNSAKFEILNDIIRRAKREKQGEPRRDGPDSKSRSHGIGSIDGLDRKDLATGVESGIDTKGGALEEEEEPPVDPDEDPSSFMKTLYQYIPAMRVVFKDLAIILGNNYCPSWTVIKLKTAQLVHSAEPEKKSSHFSHLNWFKIYEMTDFRAYFVRNPEYRRPGSPEDPLLTVGKRDREYKENLQRAYDILSNLNLVANVDFEDAKAGGEGDGDGGGRDGGDMDAKRRKQSKNEDFTLIRCASMTIDYKSESPLRYVNMKQLQSLTSRKYPRPEDRIDIRFKAPVRICWNGWADLQRSELMEQLKPFDYRNMKEYVPRIGDYHVAEKMIVDLYFDDGGSFAIPFRRPEPLEQYLKEQVYAADGKASGKRQEPRKTVSAELRIKFFRGSKLSFEQGNLCRGEQGTTSVVKSKFQNCMWEFDGHPNVHLIQDSQLSLNVVMRYPKKWNAKYKWDVELGFVGGEVSLVRAHQTFLQDLATDWTSYAKDWNPLYFYPTEYGIRLTWNHSQWNFNVNEYNVQTEPHDSTTMTLRAPYVSLDITKRESEYKQAMSDLKIELRLSSAYFRLRFPAGHPLRSLLPVDHEDLSFMSIKDMTLDMDCLWKYGYDPDHRDVTKMDVRIAEMSVDMFGQVARYLTALQQNYASAHQSPIAKDDFVMAKFRNNYTRNSWAYWYESAMKKGERLNAWETPIALSIEEFNMYLPRNLYKFEPDSATHASDPCLRFHRLDLDMRSISQFTDMYLNVSPITLVIPLGEGAAAAPADAGSAAGTAEEWQNTHLQLTSLTYSSCSLNGPAPMYVPYRVTQNIKLGAIRGQLTPGQLLSLSRSARCFQEQYQLSVDSDLYTDNVWAVGKRRQSPLRVGAEMTGPDDAVAVREEARPPEERDTRLVESVVKVRVKEVKVNVLLSPPGARNGQPGAITRLELPQGLSLWSSTKVSERGNYFQELSVPQISIFHLVEGERLGTAVDVLTGVGKGPSVGPSAGLGMVGGAADNGTNEAPVWTVVASFRTRLRLEYLQRTPNCKYLQHQQKDYQLEQQTRAQTMSKRRRYGSDRDRGSTWHRLNAHLVVMEWDDDDMNQKMRREEATHLDGVSVGAAPAGPGMMGGLSPAHPDRMRLTPSTSRPASPTLKTPIPRLALGAAGALDDAAGHDDDSGIESSLDEETRGGVADTPAGMPDKDAGGDEKRPPITPVPTDGDSDGPAGPLVRRQSTVYLDAQSWDGGTDGEEEFLSVGSVFRSVDTAVVDSGAETDASSGRDVDMKAMAAPAQTIDADDPVSEDAEGTLPDHAPYRHELRHFGMASDPRVPRLNARAARSRDPGTLKIMPATEAGTSQNAFAYLAVLDFDSARAPGGVDSKMAPVAQSSAARWVEDCDPLYSVETVESKAAEDARKKAQQKARAAAREAARATLGPHTLGAYRSTGSKEMDSSGRDTADVKTEKYRLSVPQSAEVVLTDAFFTSLDEIVSAARSHSSSSPNLIEDTLDDLHFFLKDAELGGPAAGAASAAAPSEATRVKYSFDVSSLHVSLLQDAARRGGRSGPEFFSTSLYLGQTTADLNFITKEQQSAADMGEVKGGGGDAVADEKVDPGVEAHSPSQESALGSSADASWVSTTHSSTDVHIEKVLLYVWRVGATSRGGKPTMFSDDPRVRIPGELLDPLMPRLRNTLVRQWRARGGGGGDMAALAGPLPPRVARMSNAPVILAAELRSIAVARFAVNESAATESLPTAAAQRDSERAACAAAQVASVAAFMTEDLPEDKALLDAFYRQLAAVPSVAGLFSMSKSVCHCHQLVIEALRRWETLKAAEQKRGASNSDRTMFGQRFREWVALRLPRYERWSRFKRLWSRQNHEDLWVAVSESNEAGAARDHADFVLRSANVIQSHLKTLRTTNGGEDATASAGMPLATNNMEAVLLGQFLCDVGVLEHADQPGSPFLPDDSKFRVRKPSMRRVSDDVKTPVTPRPVHPAARATLSAAWDASAMSADELKQLIESREANLGRDAGRTVQFEKGFKWAKYTAAPVVMILRQAVQSLPRRALNGLQVNMEAFTAQKRLAMNTFRFDDEKTSSLNLSEEDQWIRREVVALTRHALSARGGGPSADGSERRRLSAEVGRICVNVFDRDEPYRPHQFEMTGASAISTREASMNHSEAGGRVLDAVSVSRVRIKQMQLSIGPSISPLLSKLIVSKEPSTHGGADNATPLATDSKSIEPATPATAAGAATGAGPRGAAAAGPGIAEADREPHQLEAAHVDVDIGSLFFHLRNPGRPDFETEFDRIHLFTSRTASKPSMVSALFGVRSFKVRVVDAPAVDRNQVKPTVFVFWKVTGIQASVTTMNLVDDNSGKPFSQTMLLMGSTCSNLVVTLEDLSMAKITDMFEPISVFLTALSRSSKSGSNKTKLMDNLMVDLEGDPSFAFTVDPDAVVAGAAGARLPGRAWRDQTLDRPDVLAPTEEDSGDVHHLSGVLRFQKTTVYIKFLENVRLKYYLSKFWVSLKRQSTEELRLRLQIADENGPHRGNRAEGAQSNSHYCDISDEDDARADDTKMRIPLPQICMSASSLVLGSGSKRWAMTTGGGGGGGGSAGVDSPARGDGWYDEKRTGSGGGSSGKPDKGSGGGSSIEGVKVQKIQGTVVIGHIHQEITADRVFALLQDDSKLNDKMQKNMQKAIDFFKSKSGSARALAAADAAADAAVAPVVDRNAGGAPNALVAYDVDFALHLRGIQCDLGSRPGDDVDDEDDTNYVLSISTGMTKLNLKYESNALIYRRRGPAHDSESGHWSSERRSRGDGSSLDHVVGSRGDESKGSGAGKRGTQSRYTVEILYDGFEITLREAPLGVGALGNRYLDYEIDAAGAVTEFRGVGDVHTFEDTIRVRSSVGVTAFYDMESRALVATVDLNRSIITIGDNVAKTYQLLSSHLSQIRTKFNENLKNIKFDLIDEDVKTALQEMRQRRGAEIGEAIGRHQVDMTKSLALTIAKPRVCVLLARADAGPREELRICHLGFDRLSVNARHDPSQRRSAGGNTVTAEIEAKRVGVWFAGCHIDRTAAESAVKASWQQGAGSRPHDALMLSLFHNMTRSHRDGLEDASRNYCAVDTTDLEISGGFEGGKTDFAVEAVSSGINMFATPALGGLLAQSKAFSMRLFHKISKGYGVLDDADTADAKTSSLDPAQSPDIKAAKPDRARSGGDNASSQQSSRARAKAAKSGGSGGGGGSGGSGTTSKTTSLTRVSFQYMLKRGHLRLDYDSDASDKLSARSSQTASGSRDRSRDWKFEFPLPELHAIAQTEQRGEAPGEIISVVSLSMSENLVFSPHVLDFARRFRASSEAAVPRRLWLMLKSDAEQNETELRALAEGGSPDASETAASPVSTTSRCLVHFNVQPFRVQILGLREDGVVVELAIENEIQAFYGQSATANGKPLQPPSTDLTGRDDAKGPPAALRTTMSVSIHDANLSVKLRRHSLNGVVFHVGTALAHMAEADFDVVDRVSTLRFDIQGTTLGLEADEEFVGDVGLFRDFWTMGASGAQQPRDSRGAAEAQAAGRALGKAAAVDVSLSATKRHVLGFFSGLRVKNIPPKVDEVAKINLGLLTIGSNDQGDDEDDPNMVIRGAKMRYLFDNSNPSKPTLLTRASWDGFNVRLRMGGFGAGGSNEKFVRLLTGLSTRLQFQGFDVDLNAVMHDPAPFQVRLNARVRPFDFRVSMKSRQLVDLRCGRLGSQFPPVVFISINQQRNRGARGDAALRSAANSIALSMQEELVLPLSESDAQAVQAQRVEKGEDILKDMDNANVTRVFSLSFADAEDRYASALVAVVDVETGWQIKQIGDYVTAFMKNSTAHRDKLRRALRIAGPAALPVGMPRAAGSVAAGHGDAQPVDVRGDPSVFEVLYVQLPQLDITIQNPNDKYDVKVCKSRVYLRKSVGRGTRTDKSDALVFFGERREKKQRDEVGMDDAKTSKEDLSLQGISIRKAHAENGLVLRTPAFKVWLSSERPRNGTTVSVDPCDFDFAGPFNAPIISNILKFLKFVMSIGGSDSKEAAIKAESSGAAGREDEELKVVCKNLLLDPKLLSVGRWVKTSFLSVLLRAASATEQELRDAIVPKLYSALVGGAGGNGLAAARALIEASHGHLKAQNRQ